MKKILIGVLLVILYCFPFVYFSMYQDFANGSMRGYVVMIVVTVFLAYFGKAFSHTLFLIIGNLLSVIISFYFISEMAGNERWEGYFKPISPYQLLILVSLLNLIPQFFAIKATKNHKNKEIDSLD